MKIRALPAWQTAALFLLLGGAAHASLGDRLPAFKNCLQVCKEANCGENPTPIPLHRRLLLWDCPSECDYTCQHIVTNQRLARDPPYMQPVYQFHGKWPFYRFMGMQEPLSVLFSFFNLLAHYYGLLELRDRVEASYPLRKYYMIFGCLGMAAWTFSMIFHTRDFGITETLDYFGAGANVMYGLYLALIRIFRLDEQSAVKKSALRMISALCLILFALHVSYLSFWSWDYTYNMAANVTVGILQNILWGAFSFRRYSKSGRLWNAWPGMIVALVMAIMSLELLDFTPWALKVDAHSLWHLGTVVPTVWWYKFLIKDALEDNAGARLKQ